MPPAAVGSLAPVEAFRQLTRKVNDASMHGGMIEVRASLGHHLFQIAKAQIVGQVPSHTQHDHRTVEMAAFERAELVRDRRSSHGKGRLPFGLRQNPT
jgi:hypothetical protein